MKSNKLLGQTSSHDLAATLKQLLKDHSRLGIRLNEMPFTWNSGQHRLSGDFYYMTFANGVPTTQEFVEYLYDCLIPYCLPRKNIDVVLNNIEVTKDYSKVVRLADEARNLFIRSRNQLVSGGEPGELILYALLEWALGAPRLVSKMYLKTNNNMPVHGSDGIHVGYNASDDLLTIYFGESKLYQNFSDAAESAFKSMKELIDNNGQILREIQILNNLSDIEVLPSNMQQKILEYIDPYSASPASLNKRIVHACLLGFEYSAYKRVLAVEPSKVLATFEKQYIKRVASACRVVERHYGSRLPITSNLHLFLMPFPDLSNFRACFYEKLGVV